MNDKVKQFRFSTTHRKLSDVLTDHNLASLGDAYTNFVYSLALSIQKEQPSGAKVKGRVLAEALKKAKLVEYMPPRRTRHMSADAAEALIVYAWLHHYMTLEEAVAKLEEAYNPVEGFTHLLITIKKKIRF